MNELPKCFVIKRDADNPLWDKYIEWMNKRYGFDWTGTSIDSYYGNHSDNRTAYCSIYLFNEPTVITLEQWNEAVNGFPEKWCIKSSEEEVRQYVNKHGECPPYTEKELYTSYAHFPSFSENCTTSGEIKDGYTEITFEQFKKYVLKQETMGKKIIGYKLKEGCEKYLPVLDKISSAFSLTPSYVFLAGCMYHTNFKEAQVLDLWFDPVYASSTPDIEINGYKAEFSEDTVKFGYRTYTKDFIFNLEDALNRGVDLANEKDKIKEMARYFRNKQTL